MKKLIIILMFLLLLVGCSKNEADMPSDSYYKKETGDYVDTDIEYSASTISNTKLVYRASLVLQTQEFEQSCEKIKELTALYNGFFENSHISYGSYFSATNYRSGSFTIRIPTESYRSFIDDVEKASYVSNKSESTENISQSYYETETHINSLKIEIARLQELMGKAENMSDIIAIEKALTETEYELEQYQSTLAKYDSLVDYSTINITLQEVIQYRGNEETFFDEIKTAFISGINSFLEFMENIALAIVEGIIPIALIVAFIIILKKKKVFSKIKNKFKKKEQQQ